MSLTVYEDLEQGSDAWLQARCGILTASVIGKLVSSRQPSAIDADCPDCGALVASPCIGKRSPEPLKTLHPARAAAARGMERVISADFESDTARDLINTLVAERITGHVEPIQESRAMARGTLDEPLARDHYSEHYAEAHEVGFMVKDLGGYKIGYSPDGLVGDEGLIEIKSRAQKAQLRTVLADRPPLENMAQMQTGLFVSGRQWCDYMSWCGGMPAWIHRVYPDQRWIEAISLAANAFEKEAAAMIEVYERAVAGKPPTGRVDHFADAEMVF